MLIILELIHVNYANYDSTIHFCYKDDKWINYDIIFMFIFSSIYYYYKRFNYSILIGPITIEKWEIDFW